MVAKSESNRMKKKLKDDDLLGFNIVNTIVIKYK